MKAIIRGDLDGIVCATLLKAAQMVDTVEMVRIRDILEGKITITQDDIVCNLPFQPEAYMWFDHHSSEALRNEKSDNYIIVPDAPSAARVVYDYYGGSERFPNSWDGMMVAVDKGDSAQFSKREILNPEGWDLLNFLMDARTGLGRFHDFSVSNYQLMMDLIEYCKDNDIDAILKLGDVDERIRLFKHHEAKAKEQIKRCSTVQENLVVLDLREEDIIYAVNRFMIYALFPETNISIHVMWGLKKQNTVFAIGKSILNRSSNTNIGELCLNYGGGGHVNAGTCQVENDQSSGILEVIIKKINNDG